MGFLIAACAVAVLVAAVVLIDRSRRHRAALSAFLAERSWTSVRNGTSTVITPQDDSWVLSVTKANAAGQSSSNRIVTSTWASPSPRTRTGAMIAGPTPPEPLRHLAVQLIGSLPSNGKAAGWMGLSRIGGGAPLRQLPSVDERLLALATDGTEPTGPLTGVADAVAAWCETRSREHEQPAVTFDGDGVQVRVRIDVLRSAAQVSAFVELGRRCATDVNSLGS